MNKSRLQWLDEELDREDLPDDLADLYMKEANDIQQAINDRNQTIRALRDIQRAEEQAEMELEKILTLTEEQVDQMYHDSCVKYQDVNGISFKQWYEKSLKYYTIDDKHNVHAKARSSETVEIICHPTLAQAKLTVLKRIKYKFYDHAVRDRDFAYDI